MNWTAAPSTPEGGGPLDVIVQAAMVDGAQPAGFAISNAVQVELLP